VSDLSGFLSDPQALEDMKRRALALAQSGARGFTTGLLGAPVDIANTMLGGAGGERPVMGGEWIGQKLQGMGLLSPPAQDAAGSATEFAGGLLNPGGAAKAAAVKGPALAALLFHGSPHKFDKFDMSKIGTGEGAQAYGHGLYFAESPDVAKSYIAANASGSRPSALFDGTPISQIKNKSGALDWLDSYGTIANTRAALKGRKDDVVAELDAMVKSGRLKEPGSLYKVDVPDEAIGKMLDWDKPLSQQPENVKKALEALPPVRYMLGGMRGKKWSEVGEHFTGRDLVEQLAASGKQSDASQMLRSLGIPGIRYLDGGSRPGGKGTSNFVLFDDKLPKIVGVE
jgi:hypothetical protein